MYLLDGADCSFDLKFIFNDLIRLQSVHVFTEPRKRREKKDGQKDKGREEKRREEEETKIFVALEYKATCDERN